MDAYRAFLVREDRKVKEFLRRETLRIRVTIKREEIPLQFKVTIKLTRHRKLSTHQNIKRKRFILINSNSQRTLLSFHSHAKVRELIHPKFHPVRASLYQFLLKRC